MTTLPEDSTDVEGIGRVDPKLIGFAIDYKDLGRILVSTATGSADSPSAVVNDGWSSGCHNGSREMDDGHQEYYCRFKDGTTTILGCPILNRIIREVIVFSVSFQKKKNCLIAVFNQTALITSKRAWKFSGLVLPTI
ncbi:unnamed protein product [Cuscuta campestris]|uniref:Uncharacterized protein n=1 Tax=Cuscuta campestris TaxID=132261 RepID=A0A484KHE2_9ASTE|nr:unnamed protein product [Cuscuta campestris]